eukprot:TRINITY_DN7421_c0_g1_i1.p1 TRINITY_DN7421_c0_g1~~TRINITY_DN7421_c0_g1_i1.p1  ORF type:complete len:399 (-),score=34.71 TRINITY_DN7421_c0_g1_i1:415-1611(-)
MAKSVENEIVEVLSKRLGGDWSVDLWKFGGSLRKKMLCKECGKTVDADESQICYECTPKTICSVCSQEFLTVFDKDQKRCWDCRPRMVLCCRCCSYVEESALNADRICSDCAEACDICEDATPAAQQFTCPCPAGLGPSKSLCQLCKPQEIFWLQCRACYFLIRPGAPEDFINYEICSLCSQQQEIHLPNRHLKCRRNMARKSKPKPTRNFKMAPALIRGFGRFTDFTDRGVMQNNLVSLIQMASKQPDALGDADPFDETMDAVICGIVEDPSCVQPELLLELLQKHHNHPARMRRIIRFIPSVLIFAQKGGTCYAHAIARVAKETMERIVGRAPPPPKQHELVDEMVSHFGKNGAVTRDVVDWICKRHRLIWQELNIDCALDQLNLGRSVVFTYRFR